MTSNEIKSVENIKAQYEVKEPTRLDMLKALNKKVKRGATVFSYAFGTAGSLVLGTGMCFAMEVIGSGLMIPGIAIGAVGIGLVSLTYPIYKRIVARSKKKHAREIIDLSDEILNNNR